MDTFEWERQLFFAERPNPTSQQCFSISESDAFVSRNDKFGLCTRRINSFDFLCVLESPLQKQLRCALIREQPTRESCQRCHGRQAGIYISLSESFIIVTKIFSFSRWRDERKIVSPQKKGLTAVDADPREMLMTFDA